MSVIIFKSKPYIINGMTIVRLPDDKSKMLPSRGQVMVNGKLNGHKFQSPLEPDGKGSHWLELTRALKKLAQVNAGDILSLEIESTKDWPEPIVPEDLKATIESDDGLKIKWLDITPMARWEWIRWINATEQPKTREKRIQVSKSKMLRGERRPCCFNRSMCCVPSVSKSGILLSGAV